MLYFKKFASHKAVMQSIHRTSISFEAYYGQIKIYSHKKS